MPESLWSQGAVVIGCRPNTAEFVDSLLAAGRPLAGILTLARAAAEKAEVPAWTDLVGLYGARVPVYTAQSYGLKSDEDRVRLSLCRADVGFCVGWQRLLPEWFLASVRHGVFGMHASQHPLPGGRGRSPITWGIIHGAERLHGQIFRYGTEADSGPVLADVPIDVLAHDDVHSVQQKCRVIFSRTVEALWDRLIAGNAPLRALPTGAGDSFYPKRTPDDGKIDWSWSVRRIVDWVRAQTRPYPGAFCVANGRRCKVWRAYPFAVAFAPAPLPGTIVERFFEGGYVIQAGDGTVHLTDHDIPTGLPLGARLS